MSKTYQALPVLTVNENNSFTHPQERPELVYREDPGSDVLINFEVMKPLSCDPHTTIDEANVELQSMGRHLMMVIEDEKIIGIVSSEDIMGEKPTRIMELNRVKRSEIPVSEVMTKIDNIIAIDYQELSHAKVGNVLSTLTDNKKHYAIVVDLNEETGQQNIHGMVYLYDIVKQLANDLPEELKAAGSLLELKRDMQ
jgi:CBS domain containing-hemolysin-like protein